MAAEAVVDFVGQDDKLDKALAGIQGKVEGLSGKMSSALKVGLGLFSAEKVMQFGKAVVSAAGASEEYKDAWAGVQESVNKVMVALGGPIIEALEAMIPLIDEIAEKIAGWGEGFGTELKEWQRDMAWLIGKLTPGVTGEEAVAEFDRQQADREKERERRRKEREDKEQGPERAKQKLQDEKIYQEEILGGFQKQLEAVKKLDQEYQKTQRAKATKQIAGMFGGFLSTAPLSTDPFMFGRFGTGGANRFERESAGIFKDIGRNIAGGSDTFAAIGEAIGDKLNETMGGKDGKGFTASFEGLTDLFKRISSGAASTPEAEATKKTASNSDKQVTLQERAAKASEGIWDLFKSGQALIAKYS